MESKSKMIVVSAVNESRSKVEEVSYARPSSKAKTTTVGYVVNADAFYAIEPDGSRVGEFGSFREALERLVGKSQLVTYSNASCTACATGLRVRHTGGEGCFNG